MNITNMSKQVKVVKKKRNMKVKLHEEFRDLGDNIVTGKRTRKVVLKDGAYFESITAHKKTCHPKGGFVKGSKAGYDYYYDGNDNNELPFVQDDAKYDSDFIVSDDEHDSDFIVSDDEQ